MPNNLEYTAQNNASSHRTWYVLRPVIIPFVAKIILKLSMSILEGAVGPMRDLLFTSKTLFIFNVLQGLSQIAGIFVLLMIPIVLMRAFRFKKKDNLEKSH